ncbi:hypothetical protein, partial [Streptomyces sp. NPDC001978]|uniref:hypothetical protein n=1 Tax=Streptomyces sp. NPDC001978 TaxID=3364627 RepID=UPI0036A06B90
RSRWTTSTTWPCWSSDARDRVKPAGRHQSVDDDAHAGKGFEIQPHPYQVVHGASATLVNRPWSSAERPLGFGADRRCPSLLVSGVGVSRHTQP